MSDRIDVAVIGAGVIGAAAAMELSRKKLSVWILEAGPRPAEGVTSRNSGVIHSGLYYPPASLKAESCIRGNRLLYEWCEKKNVPYARTGKVVAALSNEDEEALDQLRRNAEASGVKGLRTVSGKELAEMAPGISAVSAIFCPDTGIVDPAEFTRSLLADAEENGAVSVMNGTVRAIRRTADGYLLETSRGPVAAANIVNAAGLYADDVAKMAGIDRYTIHPCRGDYFRLRSSRKYRHLVYPVKRKGDPGLGVHLTIDISGAYRLGPDAEYVSGKGDFSSAEGKLEAFHRAAERLLGPIDPSQLSYDTCGIRPKLRAPDEKEEKDFIVREDLPGFINMVGIESPGLTAALALAETVSGMI